VLIGILSDTHGRADAMAAAMRMLRARGVEFFFHCGDIGSEAVLDLLAGEPALAVWGNTDPVQRLGKYAHHIGVNVADSLGEIELARKRFAVTHGDDHRLVQRILADQRHDYLLLGHSHARADRRQGAIRVINPGALYRAAEKTVALLDTETGRLEFLTVEA
jgi:putative phosphoesterase